MGIKDTLKNMGEEGIASLRGKDIAETPSVQSQSNLLDPEPNLTYSIPGVKSSDLFVLTFKFTKTQDATIGGGATVKIEGSDVSVPSTRFVRFSLPLNPKTVSFNYTKNINNQLTEGGYKSISWGNGMTTISFSGSTPSMVPDVEYTINQRLNVATDNENLIANGSLTSQLFGRILPADMAKVNKSIFKTKAFLTLMKLRYYFQYFNGGNEVGKPKNAQYMETPRTCDIFLQLFDNKYKGYLTTFGFTLDADDPFKVNYNLSFDAYPSLDGIGVQSSIEGEIGDES